MELFARQSESSFLQHTARFCEDRNLRIIVLTSLSEDFGSLSEIKQHDALP